jgi:glycosyltransferase involved in cell wall biosynthesis/SAM-dependent methyltransferase
MTASTRLSVVMPSFNHAKYIRMAIDSVLSQGKEGIELIVMDGGSTDHTVDLLRRYADRLSFVSERDRGQADAINRGFQRARGDILCWLNSDDMFVPGALGRVIRVLQESPQAEFVYGRGWNVDESGRIIDDAGVLAFDLWRLIHQRNFIQQPSCFFRRSLLERVGPLDERLHYVMDWDLWIRFAAYRGLYVNDFWSYNRVYGDNKTQSGQLRRWREITTMVRRYTDVRRPPVMQLYLLEALLQLVRSGRLPARLEDPLAREFQRGMQRHMSGRYPDGSVRPRFRVSVGNPHHHPALALTLSPLSRYHRSRLGAEPVQVNWRSSGGRQGSFTLLENGAPQRFVISPDLSASPFVHLTCWSDHPGMARRRGDRWPVRRIIGFLDDVEAEIGPPPDAPAIQSAPGAVSAIHAFESTSTQIGSGSQAATMSSPRAERADDRRELRCWCGATPRTPVGKDHRLCPDCGTVVLAVTPDETRLAKQLQSDIIERVEHDMAGRCLHWLDALLEHVGPPGRVLEIGCGHGGFVRLLNEAGFEAIGTERSPEVADFARTAFGVRVELGPIETLELEPGFLAVCAFDLLGQMGDPLRVVQRAAELLRRPDGILFLQMPCVSGEGPDGVPILADRHAFVFSEEAVQRLLKEAGFREVAVAPGLVPSDMWITATCESLPHRRFDRGTGAAWTRGLRALRIALARTEERRAEADADLVINLGQIEALTERLLQAEADRAARLEQIETLTDRLHEVDTDRAARLEQIETLTDRLHEVDTDRAARLEQIETLTTWLREAEADRAARLEQIETLTVRVREADLDRAELARLRAHADAIHRSWAWRVYSFLRGRAGGGP